MSHFSVLVIGPNHEEQLAPYNEQDEDYMQFISVFKNENELLQAFQKWCADLSDSDIKTPEQWADEYHGYHKENGAWGYMANPNAKWDWYQEGGRWNGYFLLKEGATGIAGSPGLMGSPAPKGTADILTKGSVDIEKMVTQSKERAAQLWDKVRAMTGPMDTFQSWQNIHAQHSESSRESRRTLYWEQPQAKAFQEALKLLPIEEQIWVDLDDFIIDREQYIEQQGLQALTPYAYVKDGQWFGRGKMGWFGMSHDEVSHLEWAVEFNTMFNQLPDDTPLTLVDCHI